MGPLAGDLHAATHALLDEAINAARALLTRHRDMLAAVVDLLLVEATVEVAALRRCSTSNTKSSPMAAIIELTTRFRSWPSHAGREPTAAGQRHGRGAGAIASDRQGAAAYHATCGPRCVACHAREAAGAGGTSRPSLRG
jgi:hypothetical protein